MKVGDLVRFTRTNEVAIFGAVGFVVKPPVGKSSKVVKVYWFGPINQTFGERTGVSHCHINHLEIINESR